MTPTPDVTLTPDPEPPSFPDKSQWAAARQLLESLRLPGEWREMTQETIRMEGDRLFREIAIKLGSKAKPRKEVFLVVLKPKKGSVSNIRLKNDDSRARVLSHREHLEITQALVFYRFMSLAVLWEAEKTNPRYGAKSDPHLADLTQKLLSIVSAPSPITAAKTMDELFDVSNRRLRAFQYDRNKQMDKLNDRLYRLCFELVDRYYKIVKFAPSDDDKTLSYEYDQSIVDRSKGGWLVGVLRRGLRAPAHAFYVHIPLARLCDHYEFTMSPITGYFVSSLQAITGLPPDAEESPLGASTQGPMTPSPITPSQSRPEATKGPWSGHEGGRTLAPKIFIGDGTEATKGLYVGIQLGELPPGATGHAFTSHIFTIFIAIGLVAWTLDHEPSASISAAGIIAGLLALGSTATDWLIPRANILNAPLVPRLFLFSQAIGMATIAIWMLARSTARDVVPPANWFLSTAEWITNWNWLVALIVLAGLSTQLIVLARRVIRSNSAYYEIPVIPNDNENATK